MKELKHPQPSQGYGTIRTLMATDILRRWKGRLTVRMAGRQVFSLEDDTWFQRMVYDISPGLSPGESFSFSSCDLFVAMEFLLGAFFGRDVANKYRCDDIANAATCQQQLRSSPGYKLPTQFFASEGQNSHQSGVPKVETKV